ncbi:hypothetical protein MIND_00544600 [Mycena indigotica]|uniref:Uncharacterized protein n=1 Tax=Mycena indigotica TaxID=2126181 RepID=A0A8H6W902_9AGAR|nr:uncharacterized protein MIND_00544600 [Mycena indigotica]KAF7307501.1 hypothetical protein MIND_00544600 [Mycena indigotica]
MSWIPDHTEPKTRLRLVIPQPPKYISALLTAAHQKPQEIDELLNPHLLDPALPAALAFMIHDLTTNNVTPPLYWGGEPAVSLNKYLTCMVHATMIGRAFALLSTSSPAPGEKTEDDILAAAAALPMELRLRIYFTHYSEFRTQCRRLWQQALTPVFVKALMSGSDPAPASRFAAAILVLTCWTTLESARPPIQGRGTDYVWFNGSYSTELWDLDRLKDGILATSKLPRENWDVSFLQADINSQSGEGRRIVIPEYIPLECITMLDAAREHIYNGGIEWPLRDYNSDEVVKLVLHVLETSAQAADSNEYEAHGSWGNHIDEAHAEWEEAMDKEWVQEKKTNPSRSKSSRGKGRGRGR